MKTALVYRLTAMQAHALLLAHLLVLAPLYEQMRAPLTAVLMAMTVLAWLMWRHIDWLIGRWLKGALVLAGAAVVYGTHKTVLGPEAGVSLLLVACTLKLFELGSRRDMQVLLFMQLFAVGMAFLFSQSALMTLYVALSVSVSLTVLLSVYSRAETAFFALYRRTAGLLLLALPLMLVLFFFFPRFPPLWSMKLSSPTATTGMSDTLRAGDFAKLSQSTELAFQAHFSGVAPDPTQLYWRVMVLSAFDGRNWSLQPWQREDSQLVVWPESSVPWQSAVQGQAMIAYDIVMQPTYQRWLPTLDVPAMIPAETGLGRDWRLLSRRLVDKPQRIDMRSYLRYVLELWLPEDLRDVSLQLPEGIAPRARLQAVEWRLQAADDRAFVNRVLQWIHQENFRYTLEPPPLVGDITDDLLYRTRAGFCEHYASAFTVMMRAGGIPARVVVGYQGGTPNTLGDYLDIRQMDAHAWSEIWLQGRGWVRIDPTAAIAEARVDQSVNALSATGAAGPVAVTLGQWSRKQMLQLRTMFDYVNYMWYRSVIGYDADSRDGLLEKLTGSAQALVQALWFLGGLFGVMLLLAAWTFWRRHDRLDAIDRAYLRALARLERAGLPARETGETPQQYQQRLQQYPPVAADATRRAAIDTLTRLYCQLRYSGEAAPDTTDKKPLQQLQRWRY